MVFGLTQAGIEPVSTISVVDALPTQPLVGFQLLDAIFLLLGNLF